MSTSTYEKCLNDIFSTYLAVKPPDKPMLDKQFRKSHIILSMLKELDLLPIPLKTVKITGSKGKGTTTRFIAQTLSNLFPKKKIGMLISPEECTHLDRMRINNLAITEKEFVTIYNLLMPALQSKKNTFKINEYFSPSGLFLLIALFWFKKQNVNYYILECGRGVTYDEVGQINSNISVVTSIFPEHLEYLGPCIENIARDKLSVAENSTNIILDDSSYNWNKKLKIANQNTTKIHHVPHPNSRSLSSNTDNCMPNWVDYCFRLAAKTIQIISNTNLSIEPPGSLISPSFGTFTSAKSKIFYEGLISLNSLDENFYRNLKSNYLNIGVIISLPDDKEIMEIDTFFSKTLALKTFHIILTGQRGYLYFNKAMSTGRVIGEMQVLEPNLLKDLVLNSIINNNFDCLILVGTQTFLRNIKLSNLIN